MLAIDHLICTYLKNCAFENTTHVISIVQETIGGQKLKNVYFYACNVDLNFCSTPIILVFFSFLVLKSIWNFC